MYVERNIEARSRNHCFSGIAISITYSECVCVFVALVIQHSMRMRRIVLSFLPCLDEQYFSTLSHKRLRFSEQNRYWTQNVRFDFIYNFCLKHFSF